MSQILYTVKSPDGTLEKFEHKKTGIGSYDLRSTIDYDPIDDVENIKEFKTSYRITTGKCGLFVYDGGLGTYSSEKNRFYTKSQFFYSVDYLDDRFGKHVRFRGRHTRKKILDLYAASEFSKLDICPLGRRTGYFEKCDISDIENIWLPIGLYVLELCRFYKYDNTNVKLIQSLRRYFRIFRTHIVNRVLMNRDLPYIDSYTTIPHPNLKNVSVSAGLVYPNILNFTKHFFSVNKNDSYHCLSRIGSDLFGESPLTPGTTANVAKPVHAWRLYESYMGMKDEFDTFRIWINKIIKVPSCQVLSREDLLYVFDHIYYDFYDYDDRYCS